MLRKYGHYSCQEGWTIYSQCERDLAQLQIYHLANCLRAGERPVECRVQPPAGRTLVEFAAAAWTPFYGRFFRDGTVPGHHREPGWLAFAARLEAILANVPAMSLETLSGLVYDELVAAPMVKYLAHERTEWEEDRPFGIWRYEPQEDYVALHIHNVYMPESPFAHMPQLFAWLRQIVEVIERRGLPIARIGVDSWINWLPAFQSLFPPAFAASLTPTTPDNKGGNGWWGQFIARTGHLHQGRAQQLRRTRQFKYVRAHGECGFDAFREHVRRNAP
jgi:hypothetical protein